MNLEALKQARFLYESGNLRAALEAYGSLVAATHDPSEKLVPMFAEMSCLIELGELDAAKHLFTEASRLVPNDEVLRMKLDLARIDLLMADGKDREALDVLEPLPQKYENVLKEPEGKFLEEDIIVRRGIVLVELDRCREARPLLERALSYGCDRPIVSYYLGHCYAVSREWQKAKERLVESLAIGLPAYLAYRAHCTLGMAYYRLESYARAKQELETSAQTAPADYIREANLWEWLAAACRRLGLDAEAQHYANVSKTG